MLGLSPAVILPIVALVGIVVGLAASFSGLGGGFLMVPLLMLGGLAKDQAVGTSFLGIFIISISAVLAHDKLKQVDRRVGLLLGLGGAVGAQVGARLLHLVSEHSFRQIFATVLVLLALRVALTKVRTPKPKAEEAEGTAPPSSETVVKSTKAQGGAHIAGFLALGLVIGIAASFSGLGGGFLMVPAAMMLGMSAAQAVGTSFLGILVISSSALLAHFTLANVDLGLGIAFGIGGIGGAQLGARLVRKVPQRTFQWIFGAILVGLAARMLLS